MGQWTEFSAPELCPEGGAEASLENGVVFVQTDRAITADFSTFADFLKRTGDADRQFLLEEDLRRISRVACGMANGTGGWIILGADWDDEQGAPVVQGISDPRALKEEAAPILGRPPLSSSLRVAFHALFQPKNLLLIRVFPAAWFERPVCVGKDYSRGVFRRFEGTDLISGQRARFRLGMDALERLRTDLPVPLGLDDLHEESLGAFRAAVVARHPQWKNLSLEAFLSRSLVLSGGKLTRAGHCLLGKSSVRVRAEFSNASGEEDIYEVRNLWKAWDDLLPRFSRHLSDSCTEAFRECFLNALLHAEYDEGEGLVMLTGNPRVVRIENAGLRRSWKPGESQCRNFRLMKMFQLFGAARGEGTGLARIRAYQPDFELGQDPLELSTFAVLDLERSGTKKMGGTLLLAPLAGKTNPAQENSKPGPEKKVPPRPQSSAPAPKQPPRPAAAGAVQKAAGPAAAAPQAAKPKAPAAPRPPAAQASAPRSPQPKPQEQLTLSFLPQDPTAAPRKAAAPAQPAPEPKVREAQSEPAKKYPTFGNAAEDLEQAVAEMKKFRDLQKR